MSDSITLRDEETADRGKEFIRGTRQVITTGDLAGHLRSQRRRDIEIQRDIIHRFTPAQLNNPPRREKEGQ